MIDPSNFNFDSLDGPKISTMTNFIASVPKVKVTNQQKSLAAPIFFILAGLTAIGIGVYLYYENQKEKTVN